MKYKIDTKLQFVIILMTAILFIALGVYLLAGNINASKDGIHTTAKVVDINVVHELGYDDDDGMRFYPIIEFKGSDGEIVRFQSSVSEKALGKSVYAIGDEINIVYDKDNPNQVAFDSLFYVYAFPVSLIVIGLIGLILFVFLILKNH